MYISPLYTSQDSAREAGPRCPAAASDGAYPLSLSSVALSRERNFNRPGTIDSPLRMALGRAQVAAGNGDADAYAAAARQAYSRFNAIFYLGTARYLNT